MHTAQGVSSQLLNRAVDLAVLTQLKQNADEWYVRIDELNQLHGAFEVAKLLPAETNYLPTASSIALKAVMSPDVLIKALSAELKQLITKKLGREARCNTDIAWLRRQYPARYNMPVASPHGWHQDGAYGIDFSNTTDSSDLALLPMLTVWLPLHPCGENAPGIELIQDSPKTALLPSQLQHSEIEKRWGEESYWQPTMKPGDALVIASHTLHRTYTTDAMTDFRGCVELRFLARQTYPTRLDHNQYVPLT